MKKTILILGLAVPLALSCSLFNKLTKKDSEDVSETKKKKKETISEEDMKCYNAYIDARNKISETMEELQKSYYQSVPEPKSVSKNSFILVIGPDLQLGNLERVIKEYNRSLFDNGELAKLKPDNENMKKDIEQEFATLLNVLEQYRDYARTVIDYYKDKKFQEDASRAAEYDAGMKEKYNKYKSQFDTFTDVIKEYKPGRERRDPETISNPDEKAVAILMNAYENTLDNAEEFLSRFEKLNKDADPSKVSDILNKMESDFQSDTKTIQTAGFTDMTKAYKYSFEDYFTKTVTDFLKEARKFTDGMEKKKLGEREFNEGYDEVIRYYNYMINAYNSNTRVLTMFKVF
jgi:tetratricopeptide (TPR) repeat protein